MQRAMMMLLPAVAAVGCAQSEMEAPGYLEVSVAALVTSSVSDACYNIEVTDGNGDQVWREEQICASDFGFGSGLTYIGACDAADNDHTVSLELVELLDDNGDPIEDFLNPCPEGDSCDQGVTCVENQDTPVHFDLTSLVNSGQGFLDILVDVDFLECSAKFDCADANGDPLLLLHDANGDRGETVVLGLACQWKDCPNEGMWFYSDDIEVVCAEGTATVTPNGVGAASIVDPAGILFAAHVYDSDVSGGFFRTLALGFEAGTDCVVSTSATVIDGELTNNTLPGETHPIIQWDVPLSDSNGDITCTQHPLGGADGFVSATYPSNTNEREFDAGEFRSNECSNTTTEVCETIDFESLQGGTIAMSNSVSLFGSTVEFEVTNWTNSANDCGTGNIVIFDTSVPSTEDPDLVLAGQSVTPPLGNVLAHQSCNSTAPNDAAVDSTILFTFSSGQYTVHGYDALDQEVNESIKLLVGGVEVGSTTLGAANFADQVESVSLSQPAAFTSELEFEFSGSGAIDNIEICESVTQ